MPLADLSRSHGRRDDLTPQDELAYRIYYSDREPSLNRNDLIFLGEVTGKNEFSAEELPAVSSLHFYVSAVDHNRNESNLSALNTITTGIIDPVLRDDIIMIDLDEAMVAHEITNTTVAITGSAQTPEFSIGDVIIANEGRETFAGEIKEVSATDTGLAIEIEPMSVVDLYSEGSFSAVLNGPSLSNNEVAQLQERHLSEESTSTIAAATGAKAIAYDYETDVGPLNGPTYGVLAHQFWLSTPLLQILF